MKKVLPTEVALEIQRKTIRSGFLSNVEFPTGFHPQPGRIKISDTRTHTHMLIMHTYAHYALESTAVNKDRNLTVHSEF
jgi:hypothetical protein